MSKDKWSYTRHLKNVVCYKIVSPVKWSKCTYIVLAWKGPDVIYIVLAWKGPYVIYIVLAWKHRYVTLDKSDAYDYLRVDSGLLHGYI